MPDKDKREGHQADLDENAAVNKAQQADINKARQADLDKNKAVNEAQQADLDKSKAAPSLLDRAPINKASQGRQSDVPLRAEKDAGLATDEARRADEAKPFSEKDAVATMAETHRDNVNPNAYSAESARKLGVPAPGSINEPKPGEPKPFKVPEDHTVTTPESLAQDYPDGYVPPIPPEEVGREDLEQARIDEADKADAAFITDDPDDLEEEINQAKEDGDFKSPPRNPKPFSKKRK